MKNLNFGCTNAIITFTNAFRLVLAKGIKIIFLADDLSVHMAAICYSCPIRTIYSDIVALLWTINCTKFREDILSNKVKKFSIQELNVDRAIC